MDLVGLECSGRVRRTLAVERERLSTGFVFLSLAFTSDLPFADTADFERLHSKHLTRLPGVARVHSSFALRTVQKSRELPIR